MADGIKNAGSKGYVLMWGIISLLLFVILVVGIYYANFDFIPDVKR